MEARARAYVEGLLARGRHTFTRTEAEAALKSSSVAAYHSLRRLRKRGWLAMPRRGFYLIVDPEHSRMGVLPPASWIADLMRFHGARYYVGLLSAAALHGAAQQQPQEFQVVAGTVLRPLVVGRARIVFFFRRRMEVAATEQVRTSSGDIPVSTPEMTAYDLVRYRHGAGSLDHVATVLAELAERLDSRKLLAVAKRAEEWPVIQRLGYLLDRVGHPGLSRGLAGIVRARRPGVARLDPQGSGAVSKHNAKWNIQVNAAIEVEE